MKDRASKLKAQTLTFNRNEVSRALTHTLKASRRSPHDDQDPASVPPGLWLVSSHGIYLMSNGRNSEGQHGRTACPVAYAIEANPDTVPFEDWWRIKSEAFRWGDDSVFLPAAEITSWLTQTFADPQLEVSSDEQHLYVDLKDDLHAPELQ